MSQVPGVQHEGRCLGERIDLCDRVAQGRGDVFVGVLVEADMAITDLDETQVSTGCSVRSVRTSVEGLRTENATRDGPEDPRTGPRHAFKKPPAVDSVLVVIMCNDVRHFVSRFK